MRLPLGGGEPQVVAPHCGNLNAGLAVDDATVCCDERDDTAPSCAGCPILSQVVCVPRGGTSRQVVKRGLGRFTGLTIDSTYVYLSEWEFQGVSRIRRSDGTVLRGPVESGQQRGVSHLVADGDMVYWDNRAGIFASPASAFQPTGTWQGPESDGPIALDKTSVYWADGHYDDEGDSHEDIIWKVGQEASHLSPPRYRAVQHALPGRHRPLRVLANGGGGLAQAAEGHARGRDRRPASAHLLHGRSRGHRLLEGVSRERGREALRAAGRVGATLAQVKGAAFLAEVALREERSYFPRRSALRHEKEILPSPKSPLARKRSRFSRRSRPWRGKGVASLAEVALGEEKESLLSPKSPFARKRGRFSRRSRPSRGKGVASLAEVALREEKGSLPSPKSPLREEKESLPWPKSPLREEKRSLPSPKSPLREEKESLLWPKRPFARKRGRFPGRSRPSRGKGAASLAEVALREEKESLPSLKRPLRAGSDLCR